MLIASGTGNYGGYILKFKLFFGNIAFPLSPVSCTITFFFLFGKKIRRTRPQPALQVGRPKVPMWTVSLIHSARVYQVSDTTTVRPALLMGGQGGSAVDIIVVAPGTSTSSSVEPKGNSS